MDLQLTQTRSSQCYSLTTTIIKPLMKVINDKPPTHKLQLSSPKKMQISYVLALHDPSERLDGLGQLWMP